MHLRTMEAKLYVILGSHACRTGILMMQHKGIDYERVELPTALHPLMLRLRGFAGNTKPIRQLDDGTHLMLATADRMGTVPALRVDGRRVQTNRRIARFLDDLRPDPPLYPADPARRQAVEEAERWGDEVLQMVARRLVLAANMPGGEGLVNNGGDGRLGTLLWRNETIRQAGGRLLARFIFRSDARTGQDLLADLPGMLDRVDAWIADGVLNGDELNAADFMIAPSLALLTYRRDVRAQIEQRPAIRLVDRLLPDPAVSSEPARKEAA
jgi:glutathione S-transferase